MALNKNQLTAESLAAMGCGFLLTLGAVLMVPHGDLFKISNLVPFWISAAIMGGGFALSWTLRSVPAVLFWAVALITRSVLLAMEPGDDIWRYLWEGGIQLHGFSPYHLAPNAPVLETLRTEWWSRINHINTSAIYPPLAQVLFRWHALAGQNALLFKASFTISDLAVCWLLVKRFGISRAVLYAWNPLVIYSFSGGGHYDSWFLLPLVGAWLLDKDLDKNNGALNQKKQEWIDLLLGISIAMKWITLPLLIQRCRDRWTQGNQRSLVLLTPLIGLTPLAIGSLVYCQNLACPLIPTQSSFVSHGRSAEWLPFWVGQIWPWTRQSNLIYGILLLLLFSVLLWRCKSLGSLIGGYLMAVLLLSPVVHAWYFTWLIPFAVPTQNWGVRLISLSAFGYFVLPSRLPDWQLTTGERLGIWLPLILGWLVSSWLDRRQRTDSKLQLY